MNIKKQLRSLLIEASYAFHVGKVDTSDLKPYESDQMFKIDGTRDTGHFGSGMYFSTYDYSGHYEEDRFSLNYGDKYLNNKSELIQVKGFENGGGVYRVDMDIYQNLYKVKSEKHATFLYRTLKKLNGLAAHSISELKDEYVDRWFISSYRTIKHNFKYLNLNLPPLREFVRMLIQLRDEMKENGGFHTRNQGLDRNIPSFSTRIMEYNGFNGVNVSGIELYDNTLHGSVIYDINKTSSEMKRVETNYYASDDIQRDVIGDEYDVMTKFLRGERINSSDLNRATVSEQNRIAKDCTLYLDEESLKILTQQQQRRYFSNLGYKIKNNIMRELPPHYVMTWLIENKKYDVITHPSYTIEDKTIFHHFLYEYEDFLSESEFKNLCGSINRDLSDNEERLLKEWSEEYHG
jgi:hypothetical protein